METFGLYDLQKIFIDWILVILSCLKNKFNYRKYKAIPRFGL